MTIANMDIFRLAATGDGTGGTGHVNAHVSSVGVWDVTLSDAAVKDLYLKGPTGNWTTNGPNGDYTSTTTADLKLWWAFGNNDDVATGAYTRSASGGNQTGGTGDTDGTTAHDRSGNNNNGFIISDFKPKFDDETFEIKKTKKMNRIKTSTKNRAF